MPDSSHKLVRYALGALLAFSALNAFRFDFQSW
jgi:hypothetical protein